MAAATERIRTAIAAGKPITVHGDYDVDGVTSTTILVRAIRELGAECDWLIPGRVEDGYGLSIADNRPPGRARHPAPHHRRLRDNVGRGGRVRQVARHRGRRHRSPPARRRAARLPDRPSGRLGLSVPRPLRGGRRIQGRRGAPGRREGRARPRSGRARDHRRHGPAHGREPLTRAARARAHAARAPARPARAHEGLERRARARERDRRLVSPLAADQRGRAPLSRRRRR